MENSIRSQKCKDCGMEVEWRLTNDGRLNKRGDPLKLPYEVRTGSQHRCQAYFDRVGRKDYKTSSNADKARGIDCKFCKGKIMFSEDQRSASGKMIPLEMDGSTPHDCPNKPSSSSSYSSRGGGGGGGVGRGGKEEGDELLSFDE